MKRMIRRFSDQETGAASIEYGLVASVIFLAVVATATVLGARVGALYDLVLGSFP